MDSLHHMLMEDEIVLCGVALLAGVALGFAVGLVRARRAGRAA